MGKAVTESSKASPVRDNGCCTSQSEEAVADQHAPVIPSVPVLCDVLVVDNEGECVGESLEKMAGHVHTDERGGASHACQIVCEGLRAHLEVVHKHGSQGGCGCIAAARDNDHSNLQEERE